MKAKYKILHYPYAKKYAVKYKNGWLKQDYYTKIYRKETYFNVITFFNTSEEAEKAITLHQEQSNGVTVIEVKVKE